MNRTVLKTGLFLCVCSLTAMARTAHTQALSLSVKDDSAVVVATTTPFLETTKPDVAELATKQEPVKVEPPKPVEYIVQPGDSLSTIAATYQTTWKRLYDKNTELTSPDVINVNEHLIIPGAEEVLTDRDVPAAPAVAPQPSQATASSAKPKIITYSAGSSAGNSYIRGYCTWYAKNRRPDLPNNLGNAISWVSRAAAQGFATGTTPRVGAVGQSGNHVAFVESVNSDGTITVSEMNWQGWNIISSRTTLASSFSYIY